MEVLKTKRTADNGYIYVVKLTDDSIVTFSNKVPLTNDELIAHQTTYLDIHQYDDILHEKIEIIESKTTITTFVTHIKNNPTTNFSQYNSWVSGLDWYEEATVKYFIYTIAFKLAARAELDVSTYNESQIYVYVRNWIVNNEVGKIQKIVFNGQ